MKFVHMADLHLDSPFINLVDKKNFAKERRLEQRKAMKDIVEYIKLNNIPYLFIAGDLYEQEYIKKSTIEYINNLFKEISNTKIFITPGNHDPYINNSFYKQFNWNKNVYIFKDKFEVIEEENLDIYGYGFNDFYMQESYSNIEIKNKNKLNILIMHATLDGGKKVCKVYNPVTSVELKKLGFNYIALGHIHKKSFDEYENQKIIYPGSTVSLGFDELGERGVIIGEIDEKSFKLNLEFLPIDTKQFKEESIDITQIYSEEELIERINKNEYLENNFYQISLIGKRNFEINIYEIIRLIKSENIIKIKDKTNINYNIKEIARENSLKGLFAKNILSKIEEKDINEEEKKNLENAFEIGINILNK